MSPGQAHDSKYAAAAIESARVLKVGRKRVGRLPSNVVGDKGYSYPGVRAHLIKLGVRPVIPTRSDQKRLPGFSRRLYRGRNAVERCVGWLKENRRLGTRYEKLAVTFHAMTKLAIIHRYFRLADPSNRT